MNLKENISRRSIWVRLVYMIVLAVAFWVAELVAIAVIVFQFLCSLFTGKPNDQLLRFGRNLARYFQEITAFMTFATKEKPFPFGPWPDEPASEPGGEAATTGGEVEKAADASAGKTAAAPKKRSTRRSPAKPKARTRGTSDTSASE